MQNGLRNIFILLVLFVSIAQAKITNSIALVGMSMDYREYDRNGKILDSEKSSLSEILGYEMGIGFSFLESQTSRSKIDITLMSVAGETEYVGSYIVGGLGYGSVVSSTQNHVIDTDIAYTYSRKIHESTAIYFGLGLGYRFWERKLSYSQVEQYTWFYVEPSLGVSLDITKKLNIDLSVGYQYAINPMMSESAYGLDFDLGQTDIKELNIALTYSFTQKFGMFIEGTFQEQKIEASTVEYDNLGDGYYEPDSTANNQYIKIGMIVKY